jgi:hypothetical protein
MSEEKGKRTYREGPSKDIWLHICTNGGRWTVDEIAEQFNLHRGKANHFLQEMTYRRGQLVRFHAPSGRVSFGVTKECAVPFGVTIRDLASAGLIEAAD